MPELKFIPNEADEGEGLSDAGIETYRADPFPAVARETSQNSRDAHDKAKCPDLPVRLVIEKLNVPTRSFPGIARYRHIAELCLQSAISRKEAKETEFFKQAAAVLKAENIAVLKISDYNTTGLLGPCKEGSPFHSLVKSSGISNKGNETSGGSFGIGKSAVYSASDLQTVFYSTSYIDGSNRRRFLCQGKTKFCSFSEGTRHFRSIGYWGEPVGYMPIENQDLAPDWLRRDDTGTTVCSIAVRESEDWHNEIMGSLLINFFCAIHRGQMEFIVAGDELNSRTVRHRFDSPEIQAAAATKSENFDFARQMYACLTDLDETHERQIEIANAGAFRLRLMLKDGLPKRVGILRNGMYICDNLGQFGERFARFPMYRDFVAFVEPADDASNAWLRRMENPRHDEFSAERLLDPEQRRAAREAGKRLAAEIRDAIKTVAKAAPQTETDLQELSEFFAIETDAQISEEGESSLNRFKVNRTPVRTRVRQTKLPASKEDGNSGGRIRPDGPGPNDPRPAPGPDDNGPGPGAGDGSKSSLRPLKLTEPRTMLVEGHDERDRRVFFTPAVSGPAVLLFESSGLNEAERLVTDPIDCRVTCVAGQRQSVVVRFKVPYSGPVEITGWVEEGATK